jgi:putative transcriptional regulator
VTELLTNKVKALRLAKGLTQKELATAAKVTRQTMSLIEKGEYNPSIALCLRICYCLNQTLDQVFWISQEEFKHEKNN